MPESLSELDQKWLSDFLYDAIASPRLTAWEDQFVADLKERFDQYGGDTYISDKQWAILERIESKVYGT
jgi:hypothetical protein